MPSFCYKLNHVNVECQQIVRGGFIKDLSDVEPIPGYIYRQISKHIDKRDQWNRWYNGNPKKRKASPKQLRNLRNGHERASLKYAKKIFPHIFDVEHPDVPEEAPRLTGHVPRGTSSRGFALVMLKYLQWEKFVSSGRYEKLREYIIQQSFKRKKQPSGQPSKFNNVRCSYDGHSFDSIIEKNRYVFLKLQEKYGIIKDLEVHPSYPLGDDINGPLVIKSKTRKGRCTYKPDFRYKLVATEEEIVEDVKSVATMEEYAFKVKRAIWEWFYGKELKIVTSVAAKPGSTKY